jgi:hypothetical protein
MREPFTFRVIDFFIGVPEGRKAQYACWSCAELSDCGSGLMCFSALAERLAWVRAEQAEAVEDRY